MRLVKIVLRTLGALVVLLGVAVGAFVAWHWAPDRPVSALAARWAPEGVSAFAEIDGMRVHYRDEGPKGDPEPVVLLHGTSDSLHAWDGWAAGLVADGRRVIRFDLPGFGLTGPPSSGGLEMERYRAVTLALMDRLGVDRAVLGGNSFGGRVAWTLALHHPERVSRLVLVASSGIELEPAEVPAGFRLAGMPGVRDVLAGTLPKFILRMSLESVYGDPARLTEAEVDRFYEITLREGNRAVLFGAFEFTGSTDDAARMAEVTQPALLLWGAEDRLIPPAAGEAFLAALPNAELTVMPGLGHVPMTEDPAATLAVLRDFLAR